MNRNQKIFVALSIITVLILFSATIFQAYQQEAAEDDKIKIVATFYPLAYFAEKIGGENVSVKTLIPHNTEVHAWQPSTSDIVATDDADIVVYNGIELDHWFEEDILPAISKSNKIIVETTAGIDLIGDDDEAEENGESNHDHGEFDPHTWLSPFIAAQQAEKIYDAIVKVDPSNENYYSERWTDLKARFDELDSQYMSVIANKTKDEIFTTHAAFSHLAERYGFEQHGVIGISADEQPSTSTIAELVELMVEQNSFTIYVDPVYADDYANTLKRELESETDNDVKILKLYFMLGPMDGLDYFEQMEANLDNLKTGLLVN